MTIRQTLAILFAQPPLAGRVKTRLVPPLTPEEAALLSEAFLLDTLDNLASLGEVDLWVAYPPIPGAREHMARVLPPGTVEMAADGVDLEQRLEAGFERGFAAGYRAILAVSSDSPLLPVESLRRAVERLRRRDAVIGPCVDGGYYLIGLTRPAPTLFRALPWTRPALFGATTHRLDELAMAWETLPAAFDVDVPPDLIRLVTTWRKEPDRVPPRTSRLLAEWLADRLERRSTEGDHV